MTKAILQYVLQYVLQQLSSISRRHVPLITLALLSVCVTARADIVEDFGRADSASIGNGWVEKIPAAFTLTAGEAVKQASSYGYRDNVVIRPAVEDVLDVEASVEFRISGGQPGYPQLWTRVQSATVLTPDYIEGYILYINNSTTAARVSRQNGGGSTPLMDFSLSTALNTTDTYRLRMSNVGTGPVVISAFVERFNGVSWDVIGQASINDNGAQQFTTAGSVGFAGHYESGYVYDNFIRTNLGGPNPVPVTLALTPNSNSAGSALFTLTVNGTDFVPNSVVRWNSSDRSTTYVSSTQLQATITAADVSVAGTAAVSVFNPAPAGGESNAQTFTIDVPVTNPVPITTVINPATVTEGGNPFTLTVDGTDFIPGSVVRWNGSDRPTAYVSSTQMQATINAADIAAAGTAAITVFNPAPGGGISNTQTMTIDPLVVNNPIATLGSLNPGSATAGGSDFILIINGSEFVNGSVAQWNGMDRVTTFISSTQIQSTITAADINAAGSAAITVFNPTPGGGVSNVLSFSVLEAGSQFTEDFTRADGLDLGNAWIEKIPAAFDLLGGEAVKQSVVYGYLDNLVYRPSNEDLLDVEVSVEFRLSGSSPGYPQLWTRVQSGTAAIPGWVEGYILYVNNSTTSARMSRQNGSGSTPLVDISLSSSLNTTDLFRLRMSTTGSIPVTIAAFIERFNAGSWDVIGQATVNDNDALQIVTPGTVGFSGHYETGYSYDNFIRTNLGGDNPLPVTVGVNPSSTLAGSSLFTLTVSGSGFVPGSVVRWNGVDRATTYVSAVELQATILAVDVASAGSATVTVFNPAPGGGESNAQTFTIDAVPNNPMPVTSAINPVSITEGGSAFTLTVAGADFIPGSVVRWNGSDRTTAYVSATQLQAAITTADIAVAGSANISVFTPTPGGGESNFQTFTIDPFSGDNPLPAVSGLVPGSVTEGGADFTLTVNGSGFVAASIVRWNTADRITTFVSDTQIQATIPASDIASAGNANVSVFNPTPGGGLSNLVNFTIDAASPPVYSISSIQPDFGYAGVSDFILTVNGYNFTASSTVRWNGADRVTTFVSSTELQAMITTVDMANAGAASVTVNTPVDGTTEPLTFVVLDPLSYHFSDSFNRANSETINNDWTEKNAAAYSIQNGQVVGVPTQTGAGTFVYRDNIVYRPAIEDLADVEVSTEFIRQTTGAAGREYSQLHARVQRDSVTISDTLASYLMYIEESLQTPPEIAFAINQAVTSEGECIMGTFTIPTELVAGERYRMRFRVTGSFPVVLQGFIDQFNGESWNTIGQGSMVHDDTTQPYWYYCDPGYVPAPIMTSGAVGFSKWFTDTQVYDNFYWVDLGSISGPPNPVPVLNSINPSVIAEGSDAFTLTVTGSDFVDSSVVHFNGIERSTTFVSASELQAQISAADVAAQANANITVMTPVPGGGISDAVTLEISSCLACNPVPATNSITPVSVIAGDPDFVLTVTGTDFVAASVVRWNGLDRATNYISATELQALIPAADIATIGSAVISVFNPLPGGGTSNTQLLNIYGAASFNDDFTRIDSGTIGNGWLEKSPAVFNISGNAVTKQASATGYLDNLVYRPAAEDLLDVEASVEFRINSTSLGYPQLWTRLQSATVLTPNFVEGYIVYIGNSTNQAHLSRQNGSGSSRLADIALSASLNTSDLYRMRMRNSGSVPVVVEAYIERFNGTTWDVIGQAIVNDNDASQIGTAGSVGFSANSESGTYTYDNFVRTPLP